MVIWLRWFSVLMVLVLTNACEKKHTDDWGITWVPIPDGTYTMGCSPGDTDCGEDEGPYHSVAISRFYMMEAEATEAQYAEAMESNPSAVVAGPSYPVENLDWEMAALFCDSVGGRLPTEAEWEYAARGGTTSRFPCGEDKACLDRGSWYGDNSGGAKHPVAQKGANEFGLYDAYGNVWEWVEDWYAPQYDLAGAVTDPSGPTSGNSRVVRGGGFDDEALDLRASYRDLGDPSLGYYYVGVRCVKPK
jgi:formylglycine-generating enzyme required for sulfatase activity